MTVPFSEILSVTRDHFMPGLTEQLFKSNAFMDRMLSNNKIMIKSGDPIRFDISYADNANTTPFERAEVLPVAHTEQITKAELQWREYATSVLLPQRDIDSNEGENQLLDYLETKMDLAKQSLRNKLGTDAQASGGSKKMEGLGAILIGSSGTYAGIATTDVADWKTQTVSITGGLLTLFDIQKLIGKCTDGEDKPTLLLSRQSVFDRVWALLQADQRFVKSEKTGSAGFETLKVSGVDLMVDSHVDGSDGGSSDNHLRCLNENYLGMFVAPWGNFKLEAVPILKDQRVKIMRIYAALNMYCKKLRVQGEITTVDPDVE